MCKLLLISFCTGVVLWCVFITVIKLERSYTFVWGPAQVFWNVWLVSLVIEFKPSLHDSIYILCTFLYK